MRLPLTYHRSVQRDLRTIVRHYEIESGRRLADRFFEALARVIEKIVENPRRFPYYRDDTRRANIHRFPYHVLYRILQNEIWVFAIRHNKRAPEQGMNRRNR